MFEVKIRNGVTAEAEQFATIAEAEQFAKECFIKSQMNYMGETIYEYDEQSTRNIWGDYKVEINEED